MMTESEEIEIIDDKKEFKDFSAIIHSSNLVEIIWSTTLKEIEKNHLVQVKDLIKEVRKDEKVLVYFSTHDLLTMSKQALLFGGSEEAQANTQANAVLVNSIGARIIFNFFMRFNRPNTPTKSFTYRDDAISWLLKQQVN